jgi:general secretion pathway protein I
LNQAHSIAPRGKARASRGFSLLEMLVAFSIMALSLGLIYRMSGGSASHVADAIHIQNATWLAESILASRSSVDATGWNEEGVVDGMQWRVQSSLYNTGLAESPGKLVLHRIQLVLSWTDPARPRQLEWVTLLPERPPGPGIKTR